MKDWENKLDEVKALGNRVLNSLENESNQSEEKGLSIDFKSFCNTSFHLVYDWLGKKDHLNDEYIDICHGITNSDKHLKITRQKEKYNSDQAIYRLSTQNNFQSSTGCHTAKYHSNGLHIEPSSNVISVEIIKNGNRKVYSAKEIVEGTLNEIEKIISTL